MNNAPEVSVLMSVYNGEKYLQESIESILNQTFSDFEFIIINDGSTDSSKDIVDGYAGRDSRIRLINQKNTGLTRALNNGIRLSRGKYIARQDCDDISYPERLKLQLGIMMSDDAVVLCGGNCDDLYSDGYMEEWGTIDDEDLQRVVFLKTPFAHSTVMMRADVCRKLGGYDESFKTSQDFEFWMRFAGKGRLAMVDKPVVRRRIVPEAISKKRRWRQFYDALRARWRHNRGFMRLIAIYYGIRCLLIGFLPSGFIKYFKGRSGK